MGVTKRGDPHGTTGDRHYNYPREDAVLIWNPLADKAATLTVDMSCGDIGGKINTGAA